MQKTGLLKTVFPEIDIMYDMNQSSEWHHKDIFAHTLQVVDNAAKLTGKMEIRFAALVHDIAKPVTRRIDPVKGYTFHGHDAIGEKMLNKVSQRLRLSNKLAGYIKKLTLLHLRPIALVKSEVTDSAVRRLMVSAGDEIQDLMILCRADITTKNPKTVKKYLKNFDIVEDKMKVVLDKDSAKKFQSPIRGKEIMKIFKINEGKQVGIFKKAVEEAILEGTIENTYNAAKRFLLDQK
jgi:putative nucleotidyltransferase with HDIG domain